MKTTFLAVALAAGFSCSAYANDTTAVLKTGGLEFLAFNNVSMEKEVLFISPTEVRVDYVFRNLSDKPVESLIAFPMPDIAGSPEGDISAGNQEKDNFLGFTVSQDGKPIKTSLQQKAYLRSLDVTDQLTKAGIPLMPLSSVTQKALQGLDENMRAKWESDGIVMNNIYDNGSGMKDHYIPSWTLKSSYYWHTIFPPGKDVHVSHRYTPSVGGTVAVTFLGEDGQPNERIAEYQKLYCVEDNFVAAAKKAYTMSADGQASYTERWLSYILTTGNNWAGPIKDFTLIVDKGAKENFISFCGKNVKKTGPTTFEMRATDFSPERDLDILILKRSGDEQ